MAQVRLMTMFCFYVLCLFAFLSLRPEHRSVSAGPLPSSEVGVTATEDRKGWSAYTLVSEKKPTQKANQDPRIGNHDWTTMQYDLARRVKMDDTEKGMQPGMWGKRAEVGMQDAEGSKRGIMMWKGRKLGKRGEKVHVERCEFPRNSECKSKKESPNVWKINENTQETNQIWKERGIVVGRVLQEEDWNEQLKLFSILKLLMNKQKCKEADTRKRAAKTVYSKVGKDDAGKLFLD